MCPAEPWRPPLPRSWTVSSIRNLLCAALAASVLFSASNAEARFGKHSDSDSSDSSDKSSKVHNATAVGDDDDDSGGSSSSHHSGSSGASFLVDLILSLLIDTRPVVAYVPPAPPAEQVPSSNQVQTSAEQPSLLSARLG